jgi:hypothetical protein
MTDDRTIAVGAFNRTWELLDLGDRTPDQDREMLTSALTSRHHWLVAGEPKNHAISDWLVSRVMSALGSGDVARLFGDACLERVEDLDLGPFLTGSAHEALARAHCLLGDGEAWAAHLTAARESLEQVEDEEERDVLAADIEAAASG